MFVPRNPQRWLEIAESLVAVGFCFGVLLAPPRMIPGFFISMTTDILPTILQLISIGLALPCLRVASSRTKWEAGIVVIVAALVMAFSVVDCVAYFQLPCARGPLITW